MRSECVLSFTFLLLFASETVNMGKTRIVGLDLVKGIAIFMMIIVHSVTQVIADYDGGVFLDIKEKLPPIVVYIVIYPLVIIGLWGYCFHICHRYHHHP